MTVENYKEKYDGYLKEFNDYLLKFCDGLDCKPDILRESLTYSLKIGGKRIRPVLMFAVAELLRVEIEKVKPFALAVELVHTYSLIHDDLPEMDNDDFRRGKPSNHKVFGVGNAVLAGDGLLNTAFSLLLSECGKGEEYISASRYIAECAGVHGMIAGQSADLLHENDVDSDEEVLDFIYKNKTGKMLMASVAVPAIISGDKYFPELVLFGEKLGYLFQITDDILDIEGEFSELGKSVGKDKKEGKFTAVSLYGLDGSKIRADVLADDCVKILEAVNGDSEFLKQLVLSVRSRKS